MLVQPMASLTDLLLGLVTLQLFRRLPRDTAASGYWRATFACAAGTALAGAVHHGFLVDLPGVGRAVWAVLSTMVVVIVSFVLAATVVDVLGRDRAAVFWPLRLVGLLAYAVVAGTGHASIAAIMWCESVTMACVLALWIRAWWQGHPAAGAMLAAIAASIAAGLLRLFAGVPALVALSPDAAYHLAQIPGMVLLFRAVAATRRTPGTGAPVRADGRAPPTCPPPRR